MLRKLLLVLLLFAGLTACSSSGGGEELPAGPDLIKKAAEAMRSVKSAAFSISTEGKPNVPLKKADGRLTAEGDADGTISLEVLGSLQEITFALVGDTVYFKGPTGGFQTLTRKELAQIYDPSLILDPTKGVAQVLESGADPQVQAEEDGAYRVATALSEQTLGSLVPGVTQPVNATVWIDKASSRITKLDLPLQGGSVSVAFSDYDAPVQITPPPTAG